MSLLRLRVSAIKRLSRWIIVEVAWAELIAAPVLLCFLISPSSSHTQGHGCLRRRYEGQGIERGNRPAKQRTEDGERRTRTNTETKTKPRRARYQLLVSALWRVEQMNAGAPRAAGL